jgi:tetratricopeptide (TPR) repeat protein
MPKLTPVLSRLTKQSPFPSFLHVCFLLTLLPLFPGLAQQNSDARKLYNEGNRKLGDGLLEDAVRKYDAALEIEKHESFYHQRGIALRRAGRPAQAEESFREALRLNGDFAPSHSGLGAALAAQGKYEAAIASYEKALSMNPDLDPAVKGLAAARSGRALELLEKRQFARADSMARSALAADSTLPQARLALARALSGLGRHEEAIREAESVLSRHPAFGADAAYELAMAYKRAGNSEAAMRMFREARLSERHRPSAEHELRLLDSLRSSAP